MCAAGAVLLGLGFLAPMAPRAAADGLAPLQPLMLAQAHRQPRRHTAPAVTPAQAPAADSLETRFWTAIEDSKDPSDFQTYLDAYPDGQFAARARARLQALQKPAGGGLVIQPVAPPAPATAANATRDCDQCPSLSLIPAGSFTMGSTEFFPFEGPVHQVTIRKPFYIAQRETTYDEWDACVREGGCSYSPNDRGQGRGMRPAANLDWNDAHQYTAWLSKKTGKTYRLPSEAEWEYAARGGAATTYYWGRAMEKGRANCSGCDTAHSSNVVATGSFPPNGYGLYDMAGNAAEWVEDCWNDSYRGAPTDGSAWTRPQCQERVLRGGSFNNDPRYLRSASRFKYDFDVRYYTNGFRVVREP
jgi:formylglycine-generating enzyme required for sulfatase activity